VGTQRGTTATIEMFATSWTATSSIPVLRDSLKADWPVAARIFEAAASVGETRVDCHCAEP
jgi:hypothetical protein